MSHALETRNGRTSFASVRKPAWHGLGQILPDYVDAVSMLEASGLNWEVKFGEVYDTDMRVIEDYRRTYRSDNNKTLGIVGMRYHAAQNASLMEAAADFSSAGKDFGLDFGLETAGALYEGRKVFVTATFDKSLYVGGEEISPNLVLTTSHDGTGATKVFLSPTRVVCQNTLTIALRNKTRSFSIRHTESSDRKLKTIEAQLKMMRAYFQDFQATADTLLAQEFSRYQFDKMLELLVPIRDDDSKRTKTLAQNTREELISCRNANDLDAIRNTAWGAYNAVADYADHNAATRGENKESRLFERTFEDSALKDRSLELILAAR